MPNYVALHQTLWVSVGGPTKFWERWPHSLMGACLTLRNMPLPTGFIMVNLVALGQTIWASVGEVRKNVEMLGSVPLQ